MKKDTITYIVVPILLTAIGCFLISDVKIIFGVIMIMYANNMSNRLNKEVDEVKDKD